MQPKRSPLLLATAALGVLAMGGLAFFFLKPAEQAPAAAQNTQPTPVPTPSMRWVALNDIPPRTRVTTQMLKRVAYTEKDGALKDGISSPGEINGEITNEPILQGQPITLTSFTTGLKRVVPANIEIPRGFRAVAIYVDPNSTAAGLVDVGDFVDVIAVHKLSLEKDKNQVVQGALQFSAGRLVGSDLKVLAVDKSLAAPAATPTPLPNAPGVNVENGPPPTPTPPPPPASAAPSKTRVLLAAPVDIATRLVAAGDQGVLHITIRNPMDGDQTASPEAREYPSRLVTQKEVNASAKQLGKSMAQGVREGLGNTRFPEPVMPTMGSMPPVAVATLPPPSMTAIEPPGRNGVPPVPSGPPTTDITVIRGTEKTRVIVPQR